MSDTPLWLDAFPHDFDVAHERTLRGMSKIQLRVYYPGARRDGVGPDRGRPWRPD